MYDITVLNAFLEKQLELYPEEVAQTPDEAEEFLADICAAVADTPRDLIEYLEEVGVDTDGMSMEELMDMPEIMSVGDGRYLILEV